MDGNRLDYPLDMQVEETTATVISIEQIQRLVRLLDQSDVAELELERASEGLHLALRKVKAPEAGQQPVVAQAENAGQMAPLTAAPPAPTNSISANTASEDKKHRVVAPLVGTFHVWARPKGGALVAVGDRVKEGQLVGTIQSLNVLNEVETSVAGRVVEVLVQDGQPVEYGQVLMIIDSSEGANGAKGA
jgi:acetyl-CoA carboxylase biotin carboxyl carrier protein